eukprot:14198705-Alexandrium_andersonii.AAC.1
MFSPWMPVCTRPSSFMRTSTLLPSTLTITPARKGRFQGVRAALPAAIALGSRTRTVSPSCSCLARRN